MSTILVTVLCLFAAPAFEYSPQIKKKKKCTRDCLPFGVQVCFVAQKLACGNYEWMYTILAEIPSKQLEKLLSFFFFWSSCELLLGTTTSLLISILYFTYTHLIKVKSDIWIDKRRGIQLLSVTWHKVLIQWRVGHKVNSNRISLNRDLRSRGSEIAEMLIQTNYKDSAGFTYLTWTFLFCSCIPALHDCSGCGQRDFGCWQPRKYIKFIVVDYSRGVRMI